jgi:hypothetical protein
MQDVNARNLLERLTGGELEDLVSEEEAFEELYAEGIDADAIVAGARAALRRIQGKLRILGVPIDDICEGGDA